MKLKKIPGYKKCKTCPYALGKIKCIVCPCIDCIMSQRKSHPFTYDNGIIKQSLK